VENAERKTQKKTGFETGFQVFKGTMCSNKNPNEVTDYI